MQKFVIKINYLSSFFIKNVIKKFTDKLLNKHKNSNCISNLFYCSCSVTQTSPALFDPMNCSTPGFPVFHYHPEFDQTHVHDTIQPSHTLSPNFLLALNISSIRPRYSESNKTGWFFPTLFYVMNPSVCLL